MLASSAPLLTEGRPARLDLGPAGARDCRVSFTADAELRRASALTLGMSFVRIAPEHRAMLAELALAYHRA
jgi:hypothetical protein